MNSEGQRKGKIMRLLEILFVSTKLGLTAFGGPVAHLGYYHEEYVKRRKWLDERTYADLVALCHFLPGPASSQVGMGIGIMRGGLLGGLFSFIGFTMPSAIALTLFAFLSKSMDLGQSGWLHGLKLVAVAIVAQAIWGMGQKLAPDRARVTIVALAATFALLWPTTLSQVAIIVASGLGGLWLYRQREFHANTEMVVTGPAIEKQAGTNLKTVEKKVTIAKWTAILFLVTFVSLLFLLPLIREAGITSYTLSLFDSFYRAGSLVFGGGHVVLPLLEREVIPNGWVSEEQFLSGYGATQAVPGPLFTFAVYLGAISGGWWGAVIALIAIFLPAFLLIAGTLPFWNTLRNMPRVQRALLGVNAAIVGILVAAFYDPIWTSAVLTPQDFVCAMFLFVMLAFWKLPPWIVVVAGAVIGQLISWLV
ncbi:chromate transporter [Paenibacillus sp. GSMTC-2017]|uniref:chromate transporter n=1 Tax=Paenibacillus sp. GSMTC-2017 TaxID=2794350 RepID=UPI0018D75C16|nr:chromate transporter [Paenibacillus sp. GSMTC-2017]MBH5319928.1 chromate transporter [Paenibacillus sp. GSMTC-2017]